MKIREYLEEGRKKLTDKQVELILAELQDGMSDKSSIAKRYGVSVGHITDIENKARREDIKIPPKVHKVAGKVVKPLEKYGGAKRDVQPGELTDEQVQDIRAAIDAGEKPGLVAKKFGISDVHARDIGNRKRRKNVPERGK